MLTWQREPDLGSNPVTHACYSPSPLNLCYRTTLAHCFTMPYVHKASPRVNGNHGNMLDDSYPRLTEDVSNSLIPGIVCPL
jgi:hypothetical protein